jgi:hypothetical protein
MSTTSAQELRVVLPHGSSPSPRWRDDGQPTGFLPSFLLLPLLCTAPAGALCTHSNSDAIYRADAPVCLVQWRRNAGKPSADSRPKCHAVCHPNTMVLESTYTCTFVYRQTYIHMPYHTYIHTYRYHIPYRGTNTRQTEKHNCTTAPLLSEKSSSSIMPHMTPFAKSTISPYAAALSSVPQSTLPSCTLACA